MIVAHRRMVEVNAMSDHESAFDNTQLEGAINDVFDNKRWDRARPLIEEALARMPENWRPICHTEEGVEGAFWDCDEFMAFIADRDPDKDGSTLWIGTSYSKLWWQLAVVNRSQGLLDNALLCIEKGLELEPDHPYLWMQRGLILSEAGQFKEALAAYQTASVIRTWASQTVIAWSLRSQGYALIELGHLGEAQAVYRHSLELDPGNEVAENELGYIEHLLEERDERAKTLPWFLHCLRFPPTDPLTLQLIALVDGMEPVPGPKTIGAESYGRIASAFYERGWAGFEDEFNSTVLRSREDYADIKRNLLREPIFLRVVHERLSRIYLGKATIEEVFDEIRKSQEPAPPQ
jgi:tetratricopeptide (TPR) repeat protein